MRLTGLLLWVGLALCEEISRHETCEKYDYIVVGGGTSGLVVANRLTEDNRGTVLVVERGGFANGPRATVPYWANDLDTSVLISPVSDPIAALGNRTVDVAVAAVVGGGSVVNGMAYVRGSRADYDAWEALGNPGWGWEGLLPYFRKSATFAPPGDEAVGEWNITWDASLFGGGPVWSTVPEFHYPDLGVFWDAWNGEEGVPKGRDVNGGDGPGAYWAPSTIDARDGTRVTARKAHYDPVFKRRPNLKLFTGTTARNIVFDGLRAVGVRITRADGTSQVVCAKREVILAAGAIQTPHLLQVSGIGPKRMLRDAGIPVKRDAPAVGANLQDHAAVVMVFDLASQAFPNPDSIASNATYNATVWAEYSANRTGPIAAGTSSMLALLSLPRISADARSIAGRVRRQEARDYLPGAYDHAPLLKGFRAQRDLMAKNLASRKMAVSSFPFPGNGVAPAVMLKPLSRGTVALDAADPHGLPRVQYNTLQNPIDAEVALSTVRQARSLWGKAEVAALGPAEVLPGAELESDEALLGAFATGALLPTLAHPSGSCAMMPESLGGCVGPDLRVYGVGGLRVVDASVMPLIPGAPLQATVYAVAEKAADLIRGRD